MTNIGWMLTAKDDCFVVVVVVVVLRFFKFVCFGFIFLSVKVHGGRALKEG